MYSYPALARTRAFRPHIEPLEDRLCPDGSSPGFNDSPHITLNVAVLTGHVVQFSGTVTGTSVAGFNVSITGAATASAVTDSNGNYSCTTSQANLGSVSAVGLQFGPNGLMVTDFASSTISKNAPALSMDIAYGTGHSVTLSGLLTDLDAAGRTISFYGAASATAVTDSTGHYSVTTTADSLGAISAIEVDPWSLICGANATVTNSAAVIQTFTAEHLFGDVWTFRGTLTDESPAGLEVNFSGLSCLNGRWAYVQSDGSFEITVTLAEGDATLTANVVATDWWGQLSNTMSVTVG